MDEEKRLTPDPKEKEESSQDLKKSYKKKHPTRKGTRKWKLKKLCKNFGIAQAEKFDKRWDKRWQMPVDEAKKIWNEHKKKPGDSNQDHSKDFKKIKNKKNKKFHVFGIWKIIT